jgi:hypothetical protein
MKRIIARFGIVAVALIAGMVGSADAADGSWTNKTTSSIWTNTANWAGGQVADGAGSTAWFTNDITAGITVTINTAQTNAILNIGDASGSAAFSFVPADGGTLTFSNNAATAQFNQTATAAAQTFGVPVVLASPLAISSASAAAKNLTITNGITGTGNLTLNANAAGAITISTVPVNNTGTITNSGTGGAVTISGGVGPNVTAIVQNQTNQDLTISTAPLLVNLNGTLLANNNTSGTKQLKVLAGGNVSVGGTGDLVLQNNSAIGDGVYIGANVAVTNIGMLINSGTGPSNTTVYGGIGTNVTKVIQNSTNSALRLQGSHTFTNGMWIKAGTLSGENGNLGSANGVITIGNTNGSADATLELRASLITPSSPIMVSSGNTGVATIYFASPYTYSGPVTLSNHNLTVSSSGSTALILSGGITGVGDLTLKYNGITGGVLLQLSTGSANHRGAIINAGIGPGTTKLASSVESNVTALIENSTSSPLLVTGVLTVNSGGTTLANISSGGTTNVLTVSGNVGGTGDLILSNNCPVTNGITISSANVTNIGRVINRGTGSDVLISGVIGANVTRVLQDSATSRMVLTNTQTYTCPTVVTNGALKVDGTINIASPVLVYTNGVLQGVGTIKGTNTVYAGGMVSPGPETTAGGTLTISNLVWSGGGIYKCQVTNIANDVTGAGTDYDLITVTGTLTNTPGQNFILRMDSMGQTLTFDPSLTYSLKVITCGTAAALRPEDVTLDTNAFLLNNPGTWYVTNLNKIIYVSHAGVVVAGKNYWRGPSDGLWSAAANWSLSHVPQPGEDVEFDASGNANCTADVVSNNLGSVTLSASYSGTVTLNGGLTLTNLTVNGGTLQTVKDAVGGITVAGTLAIGSGGAVVVRRSSTSGEGAGQTITAQNLTVAGSLNADGQGFSNPRGPGGAAGAGHGGRGWNTWQCMNSGSTYGSVTNPVALGSSCGTSAGQEGGGAMVLVVANALTNNGLISAAGRNGGASGGSVNITAATLTGAGVVQVIGGNSTVNAGGGGRIAMVLTSGTDFGTVQFSARGGTNASPTFASAGTVYRKHAGHGSGLGELIIDNWGIDPEYRGCYTELSTGGDVVQNFAQVVITNKGNLAIRTNDTLNFSSANIVGYGPTNSVITLVGVSGVTFPNPFTLTNTYALRIDVPVNALGSDWTVPAGAVLSHSGNYDVDTNRLQLALQNLTIEANGAINADAKGFATDKGPGKAAAAAIGASHGGAGTGTTLTNSMGMATNTYGSVTNPTTLGSGGYGWWNTSGGGAVILTIANALTNNGLISANGVNAGERSGSGGSINIAATTVSGTGMVLANGAGRITDGYGSGGGRIAVRLASGTSFGSMTFQAYSGPTNESPGYPGAAGTVYLESAADGTGGGTVTVANSNRTASGSAVTPLPAFPGATEGLNKTKWTVDYKGKIALLTNVTVHAITLVTTSAYLELAGHTGTVSTLTITNKSFGGGSYSAADLGALVFDSSGGAGRVNVAPILTVQAGVGGGAMPGTVTNDYGMQVTEWITNDTPVDGTTQYVSTGWALSGHAATNGDTSGSGTNVTLTLTNDATLTWGWTTNYLFNRSAGANGSITGATNGWYAAGSSLSVTGVPATGYRLASWTGGDVPVGNTNDNPLTLAMTRPRTDVTANFVFIIGTVYKIR